MYFNLHLAFWHRKQHFIPSIGRSKDTETFIAYIPNQDCSSLLSLTYEIAHFVDWVLSLYDPTAPIASQDDWRIRLLERFVIQCSTAMGFLLFVIILLKWYVVFELNWWSFAALCPRIRFIINSTLLRQGFVFMFINSYILILNTHIS